MKPQSNHSSLSADESIALPQRIITALAIAWNEQLEIIRKTLILVKTDSDTEALHQFRVALRKTLALFKLFRANLPNAGKFNDEFAWLSTLTNPIRDADILQQGIDGLTTNESLRPIFCDLQEERRLALYKLLKALDSRRFHRLQTDFTAYVAALSSPSSINGSKLKPAQSFLHRLVLAQTYKFLKEILKIERKGESSRALHKLRIHGKILRYLIESFPKLLKKKYINALHSQLKEIQTLLGEHHDNVMMTIFLKRKMQSYSSQRSGKKAKKALARQLHIMRKRKLAARARYHSTLKKLSAASTHLPI